jgi:hypothetical protein
MVTKNNNESGFSLISIAIFLAVLGLIMIPAIEIYSISVKKENVARNRTSATLASSALNKYFLMFGRYPLPAEPGGVAGTAAFGRSAVMPGLGWPSCQNVGTPDSVVCSTVLNTLSGGAVLIGVLPFAELNIPFTSVIDSNKNVLTYAVTLNLTANGTYTENGGQIIVIDSANNPIYTAGARSHFAVISHGEDGLGAYGMNGVRNRACSDDANSDDFENCNRDGRFRSNLIPGTVLTQINDANGATHFDDYLQERNSSVSGIWSFLPNPLLPDLSINDRVGGNIATGNCDGRVPCTPLSRLDIYGDGLSTLTPAARATSVKTTRFCGRGGGGADAPGASGWGCINDFSLASNANGADQSTCISGVCPGVGATWSNANLPPWFTPDMILGTPPVLPESGPYWMTTAPNHGKFHRGNGIACVSNMAMNGIFDRDEACNDTSWVNNATKTTLGACPNVGEYARGLNASGSLFCQTPAANN